MITLEKYITVLGLVGCSVFFQVCFAQKLELVNLEKNQKYSVSGAFAISDKNISVFALGAATPAAVILTYPSTGPTLRKAFDLPDGVAYLGATSAQVGEISILHGININGDNVLFSINRGSGKIVRSNLMSASKIQLSSDGKEILAFGTNKNKPWLSLLNQNLKIVRQFSAKTAFNNADHVSAVAASHEGYYAAIESNTQTPTARLVKINLVAYCHKKIQMPATAKPPSTRSIPTTWARRKR